MRPVADRAGRRARSEILALALTGLATFVVADGLGFKLPYIVVSCLSWACYVWGLVQQFLVVVLLASNLHDSLGVTQGRAARTAALVFAAVHLPSIPLVVITCAMALVTTTTWFRERNLYPLGAFHGWIATLAYYLVLGEDPWVQLIVRGRWV